jgi:UDP-glucose 4-epimerase
MVMRLDQPPSDLRSQRAPSVLVTGGAGYIGSHVVLALVEAGWRVVVLDDLSTGHRAAVAEGVPLVIGDVADRELVAGLLAKHAIRAVVHLAGSVVVSDSIAQPLAYYANNTLAGHALISACVAAGVAAFVFSSTAAVYGDPETLPVTEETTPRPVNPYGRSKLMTEWMLCDAHAAYGLPYLVFRYFNVAGADPAGRAGPSTPGATHLLKRACAAAVGRQPRLQIFGTDYPTPDGTCIRDFIHVGDLAAAHVAALDHLRRGGESLILNCGYGRGYSVREVVAAVERISGRRLEVEQAPRRPGDPVAVVAAADLIQARLDWRPRYDDLDTIVAHALRWERKLADAGHAYRAFQNLESE